MRNRNIANIPVREIATVRYAVPRTRSRTTDSVRGGLSPSRRRTTAPTHITAAKDHHVQAPAPRHTLREYAAEQQPHRTTGT